jgi:hypothetical protein
MKSVVKDADPQGLDSAGNKIQETRQKAFNGLEQALMGKIGARAVFSWSLRRQQTDDF